MELIRINSATNYLFNLCVRQTGRETIGIRGDIARDERSKHHAARQEILFVDLFWLSLKWISTFLKGRVGMAIVASTCRVHQITAQPHEHDIFPSQIQSNGRNLKSGKDSVDFRVIAFSFVVSFRLWNCQFYQT